MVLTRWDPLYEIRWAHHLANRRLAGFPSFFAGRGFVGEDERREWSIPLDIVRDEEKVTVQASIPGVDLDDIDVTIEGCVLTIKAETKTEEECKEGDYVVRECRTGSFHRSLRLSDDVDTDSVEPRYDNGVLTITLPVAEAKKVKRLKVASGAALQEGK